MLLAGRILNLLEPTGLPGLSQLRDALLELSGRPIPEDAVLELETFNPGVFRLLIGTGAGRQSLILKCLGPRPARRNELVAWRWLKGMGLADCCPQLLGVAGEPKGRRVWHVYEDLGDASVEEERPDDRRRIEAAVERMAEFHTRSADHPFLAEVRQHGGELGAPHAVATVRDAVRTLEALRPPVVDIPSDLRDLRDRLLGSLRPLRDDLGRRARTIEDAGGPEVLLHGDLWTSNVFVRDDTGTLRVTMIDWERAGVGSFSYDLSTFLHRFPRSDRPWVVEAYRRAVERAGWRLPPDDVLELLFDTARRTRYAQAAIWPAIALFEGKGEGWAAGELKEVDRWFQKIDRKR